MKKGELITEIRNKKSFLCVGLDSELSKIPKQFLNSEDAVFEFNKAVIESTAEYAVAYKLNIAFYESQGIKGWQSLQKTIDFIPGNIFKIADAKRGDIGNTSKQYAKTFFETFSFDAITVSPYMGEDSISPFLGYKDKWVIILALTSNKGSADFQMLETGKRKLYEEVLLKSSKWGTDENTMFVVGATHPEEFTEIRKIIPDHFILIPGVGAQGGDLEKISGYAINKDTGIIVNVSRAIIFPEIYDDFKTEVAKLSRQYQKLMSGFI